MQQAKREALRIDAVPSGEAPSPAWTKILNPQCNAGPPVFMRTPDGSYVSSTACIENALIQTFVGVSRAPRASPAAQAQLIQHFARDAKRIRPDDAAVLEATIGEDELLRALRTCRAGKPGGADGLPPRFFHHFAQQVVPELLRMYAAITAAVGDGHDTTPHGFKDGIIVALHKGGVRTDVNNYRPITLLNIDCRIFTRAHASRLAPALTHAISATQFGLLPGRQISDAACLLSVAVHMMPAGYAMFSDFRKAFDTVDRPFMLELMRLVGLGPVFLGTMLTDTRASVRIQNALPQSPAFHAGVRQGCPISPLLYLIVGEALTRLLAGERAEAHARQATSRIIPSAVQYADDITITVFDAGDAQHVRDCLRLFGEATGQCLNVIKNRAAATN